MNLRTRVCIALAATMVLLMVGIYQVSSALLSRSFAQLERVRTERNVARAYRGFQQMIGDLHQKAVDWALWDDTYRFLADRNEAYVQANLAEQVLRDMKVDIILFLNTSGQQFYHARVKRLPDFPAPDPEILRALVAPLRHRVLNPGRQSGFQGFVMLQGNPMMISMRPVLPTKDVRPHRGWIIFGKYFDHGALAALSERTCLDIHALHMDGDPPISPEDTQAIVRITSENPYPLRAAGHQTIHGYVRCEDLFGQPALVLKTVEPREIYWQGQRSIRTLMGFLLLACVTFCAVILWGLERLILRRLTSLSAQTDQISQEGTAQQRIELPGSDELAGLAHSINGMLAAISERNAALEHALEGIARVDAQGHYTCVNTAFAAVFGYRSEEMIGTAWCQYLYPKDLEQDQEALHHAYQRMLQEGKAEVEIRGYRRSYQRFHAQLMLVAVRDRLGQYAGHYQFLKDITERKRLESQIAHQALHDALTGLPNRRLLMDRMQHAIQRMRRSQHAVAVLFIDLDNFKVVNDSMGHEAGDALLVAVTDRLQFCVRETDTLARLGGDEFVLLLEDLTHVSQACGIAERIITALSGPVHVGEHEVYVTASIGVAYSDDATTTPETLLRNADTAMYQAKARGRSGYTLFEPSMNARAIARMELEMGLRQALERDELRVVYQPIHDLRTGQLRGAEALVRWQHPERGLISPGEFLPVAEETGLIAAISYRVLEQACRQWQQWYHEHPVLAHLELSVNLCGKQLQDPRLVEQVTEILRRTGMPAERLCLEITEDELQLDPERAVARLQQIRDLGVHLAIDDFGTGYSSIGRLNQLPVHHLKIDRSFIRRLGQAEDAMTTVDAIIMLAHAMEVAVTAEGVETPDQCLELQRLSCDAAQGYLFAAPLSAEQFTQYLRQSAYFPLPAEQLPDTLPQAA
ncbi:MAG: EAL domain-containing protein [Chloroherpetonaceae bacterium]|nr:EAL domain-containing protein [Chthonomonadaceae bacterium]MDW8207877.1 EAL domain-containing protein [Chloroherpetonaceae bacterium]